MGLDRDRNRNNFPAPYITGFPTTTSEIARYRGDMNLGGGDDMPMTAAQRWQMRPEALNYYMAVQSGYGGPSSPANYTIDGDNFDRFMGLMAQGHNTFEARMLMALEDRMRLKYQSMQGGQMR